MGLFRTSCSDRFFLPYLATFKLIKGVFTNPSVPIEKMGISNYAKNYFGIWEKDRPYIITQILQEKIKGELKAKITSFEMETIKSNYDKLTKLINPNKRPWTTEMGTRYKQEFENSKNAGLLWSAENNDAKYMFRFYPNDFIKISGGQGGTEILYHQTISVAYATIQKLGLTPATANISNMGPALNKLFPTMVDADINLLLDVVKTIDKTKFLNTVPLFRVVKAFPGNPVTSIEGGIVATSSMPGKVANFLQNEKNVNVFLFEEGKFYSQVINGESEVYQRGVQTWGPASCQANEKVVLLPNKYTITKTEKKNGFSCFEPLPGVKYEYFRVTAP